MQIFKNITGKCNPIHRRYMKYSP